MKPTMPATSAGDAARAGSSAVRPDTVPVRSFNYVEQVKGPDHEKYLWTSAAFSFASNMVKSFVNNGWCVQIRGPQAGGAVKDLPIHLYDLGTGNGEDPFRGDDPETREFEFASRALSRCRTTKIAITPASSRPTPRRNRRCTIPPTPPPTAVSTRVCLTSSCCRASRTT